MAAFFNHGLNALWGIVQGAALIYLVSIPFLLMWFRERRQAILLGFVAMFLVIRFWLLFITTLWLVFITGVFEKQFYQQMIADIGGPIRFISLLWLDLAIVCVAMAIVLAVYNKRTRMGRADIPHAG